MHATATISTTTLASTSTYEFVEGNVYFPASSLTQDNPDIKFTPTSHSTHCPWKGDASYYDIEVKGEKYENAAWYYPKTITERAKGLEGMVAFYKTKVKVEKE
ncbi:hypothetical protein LTR86_008638 [Recurvomyces mirabilis]|nr:hypothetical protein LTR86_008638 [Recurvomyces mirabilis]